MAFNIAGFDLSSALAKLDGNRELLTKILLRFAQEYA
jgi:hypothetical protein